ncbi:MAG: IclR family transcriptional regulator C-terminal domain-containing protein [Pseudomonadota bacterium]
MSNSARNNGQVRSLTRALSILQNLASRPDGMSLTELSESTGLPPSTTHRLLTTMEAERFVRPGASGGLWRIGVAAFFVGSAFARSRDTLLLVRPYLRRLMEMSGETANLFVESEHEAVCIGQVESRHAMRAITGVGGRAPMYRSAAGKVLLAHADPGFVETVLGAARQAGGDLDTSRTHALYNELETARRDGYAFDDEEHAIGLRCVAAPVFNEFGEVVAALSVSGPSARVTNERLSLLAKLVCQAAVEATRDFGGMGPVSLTAS